MSKSIKGYTVKHFPKCRVFTLKMGLWDWDVNIYCDGQHFSIVHSLAVKESMPISMIVLIDDYKKFHLNFTSEELKIIENLIRKHLDTIP